MHMLAFTIVGQRIYIPASWSRWTWNGWIFEQRDREIVASPDGGQSWHTVPNVRRLEAA